MGLFSKSPEQEGYEHGAEDAKAGVASHDRKRPSQNAFSSRANYSK